MHQNLNLIPRLVRDFVTSLYWQCEDRLSFGSVSFCHHFFCLQIKTYNPTLERKVREEVMKLLDQKENEFLPQVSLNVTDVRVISYLTASLV